jgi:hypothetical protein
MAFGCWGHRFVTTNESLLGPWPEGTSLPSQYTLSFATFQSWSVLFVGAILGRYGKQGSSFYVARAAGKIAVTALDAKLPWYFISTNWFMPF